MLTSEPGDSRGKMLSSDILATLLARLDDEDEEVRWSALKSTADLTKYGTSWGRQIAAEAYRNKRIYVARCWIPIWLQLSWPSSETSIGMFASQSCIPS